MYDPFLVLNLILYKNDEGKNRYEVIKYLLLHTCPILYIYLLLIKKGILLQEKRGAGQVLHNEDKQKEKTHSKKTYNPFGDQ